MITQDNFEADINNLDALGQMIKLKPAENFEGGTVLLMPGTLGPPLHSHPQQDKLFKVIQGELEVLKGKKWFTLKAGDKILVPRKTTHSFRNTSTEVVVFDFAVTPKIGLTYLLLTIDELVKARKIVSRKKIWSLLYLNKVMAAYPSIIQGVNQPKWVVKLLSLIGTLLGMSIGQEKFRAEFLRPVEHWKRRCSKPAEAFIEEALF